MHLMHIFYMGLLLLRIIVTHFEFEVNKYLNLIKVDAKFPIKSLTWAKKSLFDKYGLGKAINNWSNTDLRINSSYNQQRENCSIQSNIDFRITV